MHQNTEDDSQPFASEGIGRYERWEEVPLYALGHRSQDKRKTMAAGQGPAFGPVQYSHQCLCFFHATDYVPRMGRRHEEGKRA